MSWGNFDESLTIKVNRENNFNLGNLGNNSFNNWFIGIGLILVVGIFTDSIDIWKLIAWWVIPNE